MVVFVFEVVFVVPVVLGGCSIGSNSACAAGVQLPSSRRLVIYAETERALGADEETYSRTLTIPDDAIAKVSA
jgi:hypothetical protein